MNIHGGDLDFFSKTYSLEKENIIDFSSNINPLGFPNSLKRSISINLQVITKYPDKEYLNLRKSISRYVGIDKDMILVSNGATEIIALFIELFEGKETLLVAPTYSEYVKELNKNKNKINLFEIEEKENFTINIDNLLKKLNENIGILILCNPNNPTGKILSIKNLKKIMDKASENNIYVMIDETYIEFCNEEYINNTSSLVLSYKNLFIARGTGKFFGIPGLRLGYGLCSNRTLIEKMNSLKTMWSVNSIASECCVEMFKDIEFILKTRDLIKEERHRMIKELNTIKSIKVYGSDCNFILIKLQNRNINSRYILNELIKENILIRDVSDFQYLDNRYIRFCINLPKNNSLLLNKIRKLCKNK